MMRMEKNKYPGGKEFVFTIFDDTDVSTLGNIKPVYDLLYSLGLRTTKSVWPLNSNEKDSDFAGSASLEDKAYAEYVKELAEKGFEISFHGAAMESSNRDKTIKGLERFRECLGYYPRSYACHGQNKENLYWGSKRFSFRVLRYLYLFLNSQNPKYFQGEVEGSSHFWGDLCQKNIDYVRTFSFDELNLVNISKSLPYFNSKMPYLNACFFSTDTDNVEEFNHRLSSKKFQQLINQKGICILTVHFGKGFVSRGNVHPKTREILTNISESNGWFAPVSTVLDFLKGQKENINIQKQHLFSLELKWFISAIRRRQKKKIYQKSELEYLRIS
jgi:hypothetical protein